TMEGETIWTSQDYPYYSRHGFGASPILYKDLLIIPYDQSHPPPDEVTGWKKPWDKAYIVALDKKTGKEKYKARRGMSRIAHATPQVVEVDGKPQLISQAGDVV